jgi:hypothetical protein
VKIGHLFSFLIHPPRFAAVQSARTSQLFGRFGLSSMRLSIPTERLRRCGLLGNEEYLTMREFVFTLLILPSRRQMI